MAREVPLELFSQKSRELKVGLVSIPAPLLCPLVPSALPECAGANRAGWCGHSGTWHRHLRYYSRAYMEPWGSGCWMWQL